MSSTPRQFNSGAWLAIAPGLDALTIQATSTAGVTGNGVVQNGLSLDRLAMARRYLSGVAVLDARGTRESTGLETIGLSLEIQDSADGITFLPYATEQQPAATLIGTTSTSLAGTTSTDVSSIHRVNVNFLRARRFIRMAATVTHGATSSGGGSAVVNGLWIMSGAEANPAT